MGDNWDKWKVSLKSRGQRIQSGVGDSWEKSGVQVRNAHRSTQSIQSVLGDKLRPGRQVGNKPEIMRSDNPEIMWAKALRASGMYWETSGKQA